jgi:hypothetical protein
MDSPRGTPSLESLGKIGMDSQGVEPMTYGLGGECFGMAGLPACPWWYLVYNV